MGNNLTDRNDAVIFRSRNGFWSIGGMLIFFCTMNFLILFDRSVLWFSISLFVLVSFFYFLSRRGISIMCIFNDRLEFFFPFSGKKIIIYNDKISSIEYKDSLPANHTNIVLVNYFLNDQTTQTQPILLNPYSEDELIVLKHFQSKGLKLKIKTEKVKLKKALGLNG